MTRIIAIGPPYVLMISHETSNPLGVDGDPVLIGDGGVCGLSTLVRWIKLAFLGDKSDGVFASPVEACTYT